MEYYLCITWKLIWKNECGIRFNSKNIKFSSTNDKNLDDNSSVWKIFSEIFSFAISFSFFEQGDSNLEKGIKNI